MPTRHNRVHADDTDAVVLQLEVRSHDTVVIRMNNWEHHDGLSLHRRIKLACKNRSG
jgi:hypothetical protein